MHASVAEGVKDTSLYGYGIKDTFAVFFYGLLCIVFHAVFQEYIFDVRSLIVLMLCCCQVQKISQCTVSLQFWQLLYVVSHKKLLPFCTITFMFLNEFLHFLFQWEQERILYNFLSGSESADLMS